MENKNKKICKRRLFAKASEDAVKEAVKYIIIGILIGVSLKMLFMAVAGVMAGSVFSKVMRIKFFEGRF